MKLTTTIVVVAGIGATAYVIATVLLKDFLTDCNPLFPWTWRDCMPFDEQQPESFDMFIELDAAPAPMTLGV